MTVSPEIVTAAVLVIGDEILSGRTKDKNIGYIADYCTAIGIDLKEVRVISDDEAAIVAALNALRSTYTYVFTTGGIGPTHDDITAGTPAMTMTLPMRKPGGGDTGLSTSSAPTGMRAIRRRAGLSSSLL